MAILVHSNDMLKQKVELLVQRLAESRRREQDLTDKLHELVHSMDTQEQIKDTPEQKVQQMDKAGWSQRVSALLLFQRFFYRALSICHRQQKIINRYFSSSNPLCYLIFARERCVKLLT